MKIRFSFETQGQPLSELTKLVKAITVLLLVVLVGYVTYGAQLPALISRHINEQVETAPRGFDPLPLNNGFCS